MGLHYPLACAGPTVVGTMMTLHVSGISPQNVWVLPSPTALLTENQVIGPFGGKTWGEILPCVLTVLLWGLPSLGLSQLFSQWVLHQQIDSRMEIGQGIVTFSCWDLPQPLVHLYLIPSVGTN